MSEHKKFSPKKFFTAVCNRHHFPNPNTAEIIFTVLFVSFVTQVVSLLSRDGKY